MRFALSTNWCCQSFDDGAAIADLAGELGFDALELGFKTVREQVPGFRSRLDRMPVESVHAFCPVPVSAPYGHPELYTLADFDGETRALARLQVQRNLEFAADIGASALVLHAGRAPIGYWRHPHLTTATLAAALDDAGGDLAAAKYAQLLAGARRARTKRGVRLMEHFRRELDVLLGVAERLQVDLALENLPYLEGFPDEGEMAQLAAAYPGSRLKAWYDTGHAKVCANFGWCSGDYPAGLPVCGWHFNDVVARHDDHLQPLAGSVDFAALAPHARKVKHLVFEPSNKVAAADLRQSLADIRALYCRHCPAPLG